MVANADVRAPFVFKRGARTIESQCHEKVHQFVRCAVFGIDRTARMPFLRGWIKIVIRDFLSLRIEEIAVRMPPTNNVFTVLQRHLFAAS